jgi:hypothetical protein
LWSTSKAYEYLYYCTDNPAVSAINQTVEALVGGQALLEVFVSGYPLISSDNISWYWPNGSIIQENEAEFMNGGRTLFLVDVRLVDAGAYRCEVTLPGIGRSKSALIQLNIHSKDCKSVLAIIFGFAI